MKQLFGSTFNILEHSIELRTKRHAVLTANIANVDTPGYKAKDIPFEKIMGKELEKSSKGSLTLTKTDPNHIDPAELKASKEGLIVTSNERGTPNNVDLDQEMAKLMENNLQYQATVQALIKEFEILRTAITEGGRP